MAGGPGPSLLLCTVVLAAFVLAEGSTAVKITYNTTGVSKLTPVALPLPPGSKVYLHLEFLFVGSEVITRRQALETALKSVFVEAAPPGLTVRCGDYFTYPATTPGYGAFGSIAYDADLWNIGTVYPDLEAQVEADKFTLPLAIFGATQFIQQAVQAKFNGSVSVLSTKRYYYKTPQQQRDEAANVAPDKTPHWADALSRIQLTGAELGSFSADKAAAFSEAVYVAMGNQTIYSVNVSDFTTVDTVRRTRKMLAAATPTIILDVWTNSMAANFTPSVFWDSVFASGALNSVGPRQAKWTGTFLNATTYLKNMNETSLGSVLDPPALSNAGASAGGSKGMSAGAIAGVVLGAALGTAALLAAACFLVYAARRRASAYRSDGKDAAAAAADSDSSYESSDDGGTRKAAAEVGHLAVSVPHSQPSIAVALERLLTRSAEWKPQLSAADIRFSADATGRRIVLGGGPFSTVFQGRHLHRDVAVKVLQLDGGLVHAAQREVQLAERVARDANVVQVYGAAVAEDAVLLVMELMQGGDLRAALDGPRGAEFLWRNLGAGIAADIACGLAYIHTTGVVHRDLKSSNVLLSADGRTAKVADVGAAAMMDAEYVSRNFGTLAWAAPELLLADRGSQLDEKADSYSLGVVIWELVTGETPVRGSMRPVRVPEECPAAVAVMMQRCMAMAPADRPDGDEVGRQLQRLAASAEL